MSITPQALGKMHDITRKRSNSINEAAEHAVALLPNRALYSNGLKVIGAGWGRTGTMSLKAALTILTGGPTYHMKNNIMYDDNNFWLEAGTNGKTEEEWIDFFQLYAATVDIPSCLFWKDLLKVYPNAKVILSTRNSESWYESCVDTIFQMQPGNYDNQQYGVKIFQALVPIGPGRSFKKMLSSVWEKGYFDNNYNKDNVINAFNKWNESVINQCPKDKLLIFEAKDGWEPLCKFLNVPIPDCKYPNLNDTEEFKRVIKLVNISGWLLAGAITSVITLGAYYTYKGITITNRK